MDSMRRNVAGNVMGKKMRKRRELDALAAASNELKKYSAFGGGGGGGGNAVCVKQGDQLLSESSDELEDYWKASHKGSTRCGTMTKTTVVSRKRCATMIGICATLLVFGCIVVTSTILWLFLDIRRQTNLLHDELNRVAAGNQGMPEALQKCHVQTKELKSNQSDLYSRVINLNSQMTGISQELATLREKFNDSTATFTKTPANEKDAVEKIASFKTWINELNTSIDRLNASQSRLEDDFKIFMSNISATDVKKKLHTEKVPNVDVSNFASDELKSKITKLGNNLSYINNSLISEIQLLKEEHNKDRALNAFKNVTALMNITSRIAVLEQKVVKMSRLSISVQNLTSQFDLSSKELKLLSERVDKLAMGNSTAADKPK